MNVKSWFGPLGIVGILGTVGIAGCSSSSSSSAPQSKSLEIYSWLTAGSEKAALDDLFTVMQAQDQAAKIVNAAQDRNDIAPQELKDRMAKGNPPDSFQAVSGTTLFEWVDKGALEPLDSIAAQQGWAQAFPKPVMDSVSRNGHIYGVPLNIERNNTLFFNKAVLAANGVAAPTDFESFFTAAEALKAKGVTPLSVSANGGWTLWYALFEDALLAKAGPDFYVSYLSGQKAPDGPEIRTAIADLAKTIDYSNADRMTTGWTAAVSKVCNGEAAMLFLPDFVKGEFEADGCGPDKIGYIPMEPAGAPTFAFVSMAWPLPKAAPHRDVAIEYLGVVGSKQGQEAFNPTKGSIPARTDVDATKFDSISQKGLADFSAPSERLVPAVLATEAFNTAVATALKDFVDPTSDRFKDADKLMGVIAQSYSALQP